MSFDRNQRDSTENRENDETNRRNRPRVQAQTQRGARPYQYLNRVGQPSCEQAAILDQMILRRGLENVQELGERGELPEGCNTPMGEQVRVARVRSSWKAGVELDTESAMRSVEAQTESDLAGETATPDVVRRVISQPGRPLEGPVREEMEKRMGDSFSDVQLHTGPEAAKAASALEARAFTTGNHVVFNRGEYNPESPEGKYLLAHELAHVRQQTGGRVSMLPQEGSSLVIDPDPELEREADEVARKALEEEPVPIARLPSGAEVHVQRSISDFFGGSTPEFEGGVHAIDDDERAMLPDSINKIVDDVRELKAEVYKDEGVDPAGSSKKGLLASGLAFAGGLAGTVLGGVDPTTALVGAPMLAYASTTATDLYDQVGERALDKTGEWAGEKFENELEWLKAKYHALSQKLGLEGGDDHGGQSEGVGKGGEITK